MFAKAVGERLAEIRASMPSPAPVLQKDVGRALGINPNNISNWEIGEHAPPSFMLKKLCEYYGCSADYVLGLRPKRLTTRHRRLLNALDVLDPHEQDAIEQLIDALLLGHQRSDG